MESENCNMIIECHTYHIPGVKHPVRGCGHAGWRHCDCARGETAESLPLHPPAVLLLSLKRTRKEVGLLRIEDFDPVSATALHPFPFANTLIHGHW